MEKTIQPPQLYTSLFQMDTSDIDHDVSHLFEHVLLATFAKELETHGFHPSLVGWMSGESFEERLFIETGFYQPEVDALFRQYMKHLPNFDSAAIQHQIATLETEEQAVLSPYSSVQLATQLEMLRTREWNTKFDLPINKEKPRKTLILQKKLTAFRQIAIGIYIPVKQLTQEELFIFLRAHVLMMDIVHDLLRINYASYENEHTGIIIRDGLIGFGLNHTVKRGVTNLKKMDNIVEETLRNFPLDQHKDQIQAHFDVYGQYPSWQSHPIEYFRQTGLSPTPQMIAELATPERIAALFQKIQVKSH